MCIFYEFMNVVFQRVRNLENPQKIVSSRNKEIVFDAIEKYTAAWAKREGASKWVLHDWTESVKSVINHRVNKYRFYRNRNKSVLSSHIAREY